MRTVCLSRGSNGGGQEIAELPAKDAGYQCLGREVIPEEATNRGIAVCGMETATTRLHTLIDRFVRERMYRETSSTSIIPDKAFQNLLISPRCPRFLVGREFDTLVTCIRAPEMDGIQTQGKRSLSVKVGIFSGRVVLKPHMRSRRKKHTTSPPGRSIRMNREK